MIFRKEYNRRDSMPRGDLRDQTQVSCVVGQAVTDASLLELLAIWFSIDTLERNELLNAARLIHHQSSI